MLELAVTTSLGSIAGASNAVVKVELSDVKDCVVSADIFDAVVVALLPVLLVVERVVTTVVSLDSGELIVVVSLAVDDCVLVITLDVIVGCATLVHVTSSLPVHCGLVLTLASAFFNTAIQSLLSSLGGLPRDVASPPETEAMLPACKLPPLRGSNHSTENATSFGKSSVTSSPSQI